MDVEVALANLRKALANLREWNEGEEWQVDSETIASVASSIEDATDSFDALDGWLKGGGFAPSDWQQVSA